MTAVAFQVVNDRPAAVVGERFRVTVTHADGSVATVTSGEDTFSIHGHEQRWVVITTDGITGAEPVGATVAFFAPADSRSTPPAAQSDASARRLDNRQLNCSAGTVECALTGDLLYTGPNPQSPVRVAVVIHRGNDTTGPVVGTALVPVSETVQPGQAVPLSDQTAVVSVSDKHDSAYKGEFYVESYDTIG